jgi:predicted NUDIX family NTP pyrophosphohydrolase
LDRVGWFDVPTARLKILKGQQPLLDWLLQELTGSAAGTGPAI